MKNQQPFFSRRAILSFVLLLVAIPSPAHAEVNHRNHPKVRRAFYELVRQSRLATTRVLNDGRQVALGTVVDATGLVVTKASELKGGKITCELSNGRRYPAKVLGKEAEYDLALLRCDLGDDETLVAVHWSKAETPPVGSWLATSGLGDFPLSVGVVSVEPRKIQPRRGFLGVALDQGESGPRIGEVLKRSAAEEAGLKVNDVVTHVNGKRVRDRQAMINRVSSFRPGSKVRLQIVREDEEMEITATLGTPDLNGTRADRFARMNALGGSLSRRRAGFPEALQHDTVLEPNQCGGPVVDVDGKVAAINIARAGRTHSYAIPADVVIRLVAKLKKESAAAQMVSQ